jgi:hypothetical protein
MMGADPFMDVRQERSALLPWDAAELDSSFTVVVEVSIYQHVHLGLAGDLSACTSSSESAQYLR